MLIKQHGRLFTLRIPKGLKVVYVWGKGLALFADRTIKKGETVSIVKGTLVEAAQATPEAVQVTATKFIDTKYLVAEDFINHSCAPNTTLDLVKRRFVALKDIRKDEEITFNYLTTEWDMERWGTDFICRCGAKHCFRRIRGFRYLTPAQQRRLRPMLSPFLISKVWKAA